MSSNRSISGARQRRAGEQVPPVGPRSNTSINSQQIFAKQQMQGGQIQQPSQRQPLQRQTIQQSSQRQSQSQVNNNVVQETLDQNMVGKLSIPKAFTLVTLRLGRIEQYIQQLQEEGGVTQYSDTQSENTFIFDSVIKNINTRLDTLENDSTQEIQQPNTNSLDKSVENLKLNFDKFDKDLRETKDLLMLLMMKYEKHVLETDDKISNLNNTLINYINSNTIDSFDSENIEIIENIEDKLEKNESQDTVIEKNEAENFFAVSVTELIANDFSGSL